MPSSDPICLQDANLKEGDTILVISSGVFDDRLIGKTGVCDRIDTDELTFTFDYEGRAEQVCSRWKYEQPFCNPMIFVVKRAEQVTTTVSPEPRELQELQELQEDELTPQEVEDIANQILPCSETT